MFKSLSNSAGAEHESGVIFLGIGSSFRKKKELRIVSSLDTVYSKYLSNASNERRVVENCRPTLV